MRPRVAVALWTDFVPATDQQNSGPSGTSHVSEIELETALFKSIPQARPVGRHKHFQVISLQTILLRRTGLLISIDDLWDRLGGLYNLEALDDLSVTSTSSSAGNSPIRTGPPKSSFSLPLSAPCDDITDDELQDGDAWRRIVDDRGRRGISLGTRTKEEKEWERGVKRQSLARDKSRSSSLSEDEDEEGEEDSGRGPKRKRESTGSGTVRSKKPKVAGKPNKGRKR